jgi:hypothetical protein
MRNAMVNPPYWIVMHGGKEYHQHLPANDQNRTAIAVCKLVLKGGDHLILTENVWWYNFLNITLN